MVMNSKEVLTEVWAFVTTDQSLHEILQVIGVLCLLLLSLGVFLRREGPGAWLPSRAEAPAKRACEVWFLSYGVFWISCFAVVIALRSYDAWEHEGYFIFMLGLMSPLLLQPVFFPSLTCDEGKRLTERYSFKANLWIFIFGFVGNYWYTHYFYNVLKASYTFKSWDLNGVPIPMFFATHFYFCFYHTLSNMALRKVATTYAADWARWCYTVALVCTLSYVTAFMEALTISGFSCYQFADRHMAWVYGSAFYGSLFSSLVFSAFIYFIVSFPMFQRIDEEGTADVPASSAQSGVSAPVSSSSRAKSPRGGKPATTLTQPRSFSAFDVVVESLGSAMAVLLLLDFVRVALRVPLTVWLERPCKRDFSLTCPPFSGQQC